jgi:hypothetical protein
MPRRFTVVDAGGEISYRRLPGTGLAGGSLLEIEVIASAGSSRVWGLGLRV